jgi:hypothetical protein
MPGIYWVTWVTSLPSLNMRSKGIKLNRTLQQFGKIRYDTSNTRFLTQKMTSVVEAMMRSAGQPDTVVCAKTPHNIRTAWFLMNDILSIYDLDREAFAKILSNTEKITNVHAEYMQNLENRGQIRVEQVAAIEEVQPTQSVEEKAVVEARKEKARKLAQKIKEKDSAVPQGELDKVLNYSGGAFDEPIVVTYEQASRLEPLSLEGLSLEPSVDHLEQCSFVSTSSRSLR